jgi:hypothetical protein
MTIDPSPEAWVQARFDYEHTERPVDDICFELGVSATTLRDRARRWRWTRRRQPIPAEGPPPLRPVEPTVPLAPAMTPAGVAAPAIAPVEGGVGLPSPYDAGPLDAAPPDPAEIVPGLQAAIARVLPAIEATLGKLAAGPMPPREMERAARTLTSLTRTLRELKELLSEHQPPAAYDDDDTPEDIDAFRIELARKIEAFVAANRDNETIDAQGAPVTESGCRVNPRIKSGGGNDEA